jgi:hypothetical protein
MHRLLQLLGVWYEKGSVIVFVDKQDTCDELFQGLLRAGYPCFSLHGGKDQADRDTTIADFKNGIMTLMVATSVAARGLDVKELCLVVNYDVPTHYEVSHFCACIGSPCLRQCVHGAPIGLRAPLRPHGAGRAQGHGRHLPHAGAGAARTGPHPRAQAVQQEVAGAEAAAGDGRLVPPPSHKYHDRRSGLTEIYPCFAMPILILI